MALLKLVVKVVLFPVELVIIVLLMCLSAVMDFFKWLFTKEEDDDWSDVDAGNDPCHLRDIVPVKGEGGNP